MHVAAQRDEHAPPQPRARVCSRTSSRARSRLLSAMHAMAQPATNVSPETTTPAANDKGAAGKRGVRGARSEEKNGDSQMAQPSTPHGHRVSSLTSHTSHAFENHDRTKEKHQRKTAHCERPQVARPSTQREQLAPSQTTVEANRGTSTCMAGSR